LKVTKEKYYQLQRENKELDLSEKTLKKTLNEALQNKDINYSELKLSYDEKIERLEKSVKFLEDKCNKAMVTSI
jgi:hypothetical protein